MKSSNWFALISLFCASIFWVGIAALDMTELKQIVALLFWAIFFSTSQILRALDK